MFRKGELKHLKKQRKAINLNLNQKASEPIN